MIRSDVNSRYPVASSFRVLRISPIGQNLHSPRLDSISFHCSLKFRGIGLCKMSIYVQAFTFNHRNSKRERVAKECHLLLQTKEMVIAVESCHGIEDRLRPHWLTPPTRWTILSHCCLFCYSNIIPTFASSCGSFSGNSKERSSLPHIHSLTTTHAVRNNIHAEQQHPHILETR